jgi:hypothetical protein
VKLTTDTIHDKTRVQPDNKLEEYKKAANKWAI